MPEFRIIGVIYSLLGDHESSELQEAADRADLSPNIRAALKSLAREASQAEGPRKRQQKGRSSTAGTDRRSSINKKSGQETHYRARMIDFLCDKRRFESKAKMVHFLRTAGLAVSTSAKDSRAYVAQRVVAQAEKNPAERKKLRNAVYHSGNGETKGWLDLISRPS